MKLTKQERQELTNTKALVKWVISSIPQPQVPTHKPSYGSNNGIDLYQIRLIEQSYDQLDGEWLEWLAVARKYESKVPSQDRYDIRHNIMIELARARARDCQPIPLLRAYRIASLTVALYWRLCLKREVKVCVYNGIATEPKCAKCRHKPKASRCPYQAYRPIQSLDQSTTDYDGYECRLLDTIADDTAIQAIDIDAKVDASRYQLGCPIRLVEIAQKRLDGITLDNRDKCYLQRYWKHHQKSLF